MALTKYKIGSLISVVDEKNSYGIKDFYGININKEFMPTVADTSGLDGKKYKVIRKNRFVYSGMQTGRDRCIRISMYTKNNPVIVSPAYITFEVTATHIVIPLYFFMIFLSKEKDRLGWFYSDGSIRSNLDWTTFCDIEIELPPIHIQQKYVDIYKSMLENQKCYETALDDLKLVCDAYIEDLRRKIPCERIGQYITEVNVKNSDGKISLVQGVGSSGTYMDTRAKMAGIDISKYKVVSEKDFAYNPSRINLGSIALRSNGQCIVSPMYTVFRIINNNKLNPEYLSLWLSRKEFHRSTLFYATGSVRDSFDFDLMKDVEIPIPDIKIQRSIADMYKVYMERKKINEQLKLQIKKICPILIRGSLQDTV
ncbi:MAG: restriction endonuclease subunit S [Ruminococcus sp.]|nr:restriction endonuclease subunit S [Ruminococcus sp.]